MTDAELQASWPDLGTLVGELRSTGHHSVADALIAAVEGGATSTEVLGRVGMVLRDNHSLRVGLGKPGANAWDLIHSDVDRAFPGSRFSRWIARLKIAR